METAGQQVKDLLIKVQKADIPSELKEHITTRLEQLTSLIDSATFLPELDRLSKYIDWVIAIPWNKRTKDILDLKYAKEVLDNFKKTLSKYSNAKFKFYPIPLILLEFIWNKLHILPIEKFTGEVDVFHSSDWTEPPSNAFKVTTVHDLYPFKFPRLVHPKILKVHQRKMAWVGEESKRVIVPSESTKKDLAELGIKEDIIRVIPEAPSMSRALVEEIEAAKKKYGIQGDYVISIGLTPLKNIKRIIKYE